MQAYHSFNWEYMFTLIKIMQFPIKLFNVYLLLEDGFEVKILCIYRGWVGDALNGEL